MKLEALASLASTIWVHFCQISPVEVRVVRDGGGFIGYFGFEAPPHEAAQVFQGRSRVQ